LYAKSHGGAAAAASSSDVDVEKYARASEHGLGHVELASIVLAFLATAGDAPLRERTDQLLNQQDIPIANIQRTLRQYVAMMGDGDANTPAVAAAAAAPAADTATTAPVSEEDPVAKTKRVLVALASMLE